MKAEIEHLKKRYGTFVKVSQVLGITDRHLRNVRDGKSEPSLPLKKLIQKIVDSKSK